MLFSAVFALLFFATVSPVAGALPANLNVKVDLMEARGVHADKARLTGISDALTTAGSTFGNITGTFAIAEDVNVYIMSAAQANISDADLTVLADWFAMDGPKMIWVAGDSDFNGYFQSTASNALLKKVDSQLRMAAVSIEDANHSDASAYRVAVQTPVVNTGNFTETWVTGVSSVIMHGPNAVMGWDGSKAVDLRTAKLAGVNVVMKTADTAIALDADLSDGAYDLYATDNTTGNYPMLAAEDLGEDKYVVVSGEAIFTDYKNMYNTTTEQGAFDNPKAWNGGKHDGETLVNNILTWFGTVVEESGAFLPFPTAVVFFTIAAVPVILRRRR
jgi:hypothetical protein